MSWWPPVFVLFAASLLPIQAACNGALNRALGRPLLVVLISLTGSALFITAIGLATGRLGLPGEGRAAEVPWWAWPAGVMGAIYLSSQPIVAPRLGAATYMGLSVVAQIGMALALDHFGALHLPQHDASPLRIAGVLLMGAGVVLVARN
jgi:transporter family-2 protein